jgi:hypothetical protein
MAAQSTPSFLGRRRKKKEEQDPARQIDASDTASASANAADAAEMGMRHNIPAKAAKEPKGSKRGKGKGKGEEGALQSMQVPATSAHAGMLGDLREASTRPALLDQIEAIEPGAITGAVMAMVHGAQTRGAGGVADRAAMWRMFGMPWVGEGGSAKQVGAVLGAALGEAVARIEDHRGHGRVTVDIRADAKPLTVQGE